MECYTGSTPLLGSDTKADPPSYETLQRCKWLLWSAKFYYRLLGVRYPGLQSANTAIVLKWNANGHNSWKSEFADVVVTISRDLSRRQAFLLESWYVTVVSKRGYTSNLAVNQGGTENLKNTRGRFLSLRARRPPPPLQNSQKRICQAQNGNFLEKHK